MQFAVGIALRLRLCEDFHSVSSMNFVLLLSPGVHFDIELFGCGETMKIFRDCHC